MSNNTGNYNTGYYNSGNRNSGDFNTGNHNTGYYNSGKYNSGDYNSGNRNSGDCNSGNYNSGNRNSGNCNSGDCNSGNYNSGFFNTNEPKARLFNKECDFKMSEIDIPFINLKINEWVSHEDMTFKQKEENPSYQTTGGFLLKRSYKEAWGLAWNEISEEERNKFLNLPNFDADIFEEITGINVQKNKIKSEDNVIVINGKKYKLVEQDNE